LAARRLLEIGFQGLFRSADISLAIIFLQAGIVLPVRTGV